MTDRILIFSEEYIKITTGMYLVWTTHALEVSDQHEVHVVLNREHWALADAAGRFRGYPTISVKRLPHAMPSALVKRAFRFVDGVRPLRALRYALGQTLNLLAAPFITLSLAREIRRIRPSAVYSHNGGWPAGWLCRWLIVAAAWAGVPKRVIIIHNYPAKYTPFPLRSLSIAWRKVQARLIERYATSIVTVSDSMKTALEPTVFKRSVIRIHNGLRLSGQPAPATLPWRPTTTTVGFVGALYPMKGPHVLIDAFRLVTVPSELVLLGPADRDYLRTLEVRAALCKNPVTFLGFHADVDSFMERIDLLVVPSIAFESFGLVVLEAMKHSKAVICSDFGGMKEIVRHEVTGLHVPAGDDKALAAAISRLVSDPALRVRMGREGHRVLYADFTAARMAEQYESLLPV